jgi:hypothetical protein
MLSKVESSRASVELTNHLLNRESRSYHRCTQSKRFQIWQIAFIAGLRDGSPKLVCSDGGAVFMGEMIELLG